MGKNEILLDGSKMRERVFDKRFRKIVGVSFTWWIKRKDVLRDGGSEWYEYRDSNFILGGSAYDPPILYKAT
jgi:hypothetical protein